MNIGRNVNGESECLVFTLPVTSLINWLCGFGQAALFCKAISWQEAVRGVNGRWYLRPPQHLILSKERHRVERRGNYSTRGDLEEHLNPGVFYQKLNNSIVLGRKAGNINALLQMISTPVRLQEKYYTFNITKTQIKTILCGKCWTLNLGIIKNLKFKMSIKCFC